MPHFFAVALTLACVMLLGCAAESVPPVTAGEDTPPATAGPPREISRVVGQLLLPGEGGRRGVELQAWFAAPDGAERQFWILPDADGRFDREVFGTLTRARVTAGSEVLRVDVDALASVDSDGLLDLGAIDLRDRLVAYRVRMRAPEGAPGGAVRAGLWLGPPQRGPQGELPSLGSMQFSSYAIGDEIEWLLPPDEGEIYFLVERPRSPDHTDPWFGGRQYVFGPYASADFPLELVLD